MHPEYPITFGKYLLLQRIAVGGMAEVFRAKLIGPKGFEKKLAIKRILPEYSQDDEFVQMFVDEARISSHLHHSHIVQVFDFGQVNHQYYLAMELVDGTNLKNLFFRCLKEKKALSRPLIFYMISKLASALDYAHQVKVDGGEHYLQLVHRDVSPQNVLISLRGEIKLTDFGIAKAAIKLTQTQPGKIQGKYSYMSPEQALGRSIDHRSDIFSLGIIFFELLSGKKVYGSSDSVDRYNQATKADIPRLSKIIPDIPSQIDEMVMQMLSKDPKDRPKNCAHIFSVLSSFLAGHQEDELMKELGDLTRDLFPPPPDSKVPDEVSAKMLEDKTNTKENIQWQGSQLDEAIATQADRQNREDTIQEFAFSSWLGKHWKKLFLISLVLFVSSVIPLFFNKSDKPSMQINQTQTERPEPEDNPTISNNDNVKLEMELIDIENEISNIESQLKTTEKPLPKKQTQTTPVVVAKKEGSCPSGMKSIEGGLMTIGSSSGDPLKQELLERPYKKQKIEDFCIDTYEYPNAKGQAPQTNVTFDQALASCKKEGKTLCSDVQWERACKGPDSNKTNQQYPYGTTFKENICNIHDHEIENHEDYTPPKSGAFSQCVSKEGVFDLSGSVHEWTLTSGFLDPQSKISKGGSSETSNYASRCSSSKEVPPSTRETDIGFRCCK